MHKLVSVLENGTHKLLGVAYHNNEINNNSKYTYAKTQADSNTQATPLLRYKRIY